MSRKFSIPNDELDFGFSTSGGPGGQNVNKVATKVRLTFDLGASSAFSPAEKVLIASNPEVLRFIVGDGVIALVSQQYRSQARNREDAVAKLYELLRGALIRPKKRRPTRVSKGAKERRLKSKKEQSDRKSNRRKPLAD